MSGYLIDDGRDVLVDERPVGPVEAVAVGRVLDLGRGFPLVGPHGPPAGSLEGEAESADAREQLHDPVVRSSRSAVARWFCQPSPSSEGKLLRGRITICVITSRILAPTSDRISRGVTRHNGRSKDTTEQRGPAGRRPRRPDRGPPSSMS